MKVRHGYGGPYVPASIATREAKIKKADNVLNRYGAALDAAVLTKARELFQAEKAKRGEREGGKKRPRDIADVGQAAAATASAARKAFHSHLFRDDIK